MNRISQYDDDALRDAIRRIKADKLLDGYGDDAVRVAARRMELDFDAIDKAEEEIVQGGQGREPQDLEGDGRVVALAFGVVLLIVAWVALTTFSRPVLYGIGAIITALAACFVAAWVGRGMR